MYDIVLISPPSRAINHYRPPISLLYLGGYLKYKGLEVKIIDPKMPRVVRDKNFYDKSNVMVNHVKIDTLYELQRTDTKYIGISCYSGEVDEVKALIKDIKRFNKAPIIVGGVHPTLNPDDFKDCIIGEGEIPLYLKITEQNFKVNYDIDEISRPEYSLIDMKYYTTPNPYAIRGVYLSTAYVLASRGCPAQCKFCVAPRLRDYFGTGRFRSISCIIKEILYLRSTYKIDGFYFLDDYFTFRKKEVLEFCKHMSNLNTGLVWGCSSRVNIDEELIAAMAKAGCIQMDFGVERGSDEELEHIGKQQTVKQIKETFRLCKKYGIRTFANMLVNIEGETLKDYADIEELLSDIKPSVVSVNVYKKYPGAELEEGRGQLRKIKNFNSVWDNLKFHLSWRYIRIVIWSGKRKDYVKQLWVLLREVWNQSRSG